MLIFFNSGSFSTSISQVSDDFILGGKKPNQHFAITTRSIRLGSYKVLAKESALFTATGIQIKLPDRFKSEID